MKQIFQYLGNYMISEKLKNILIIANLIFFKI